MPLRVDAGLELGALLLLLLVTLLVAGLAVGFLTAHHPPGARTRARATRVLVGALAVVPAVAILLLANAPGGIDGQVSKAWKQATDPAVSGPSNTPVAAHRDLVRPRALLARGARRSTAAAPWLGSGAGAYGTLRLRYRIDARTVRHAHGYVVQTLADLGWVGLGVSLLALFAWLAAAVARARAAPARSRAAVGRRAGRRWRRWPCVVVVFGVHSAIDWTWFVPGNAVPALLCAGWVASRPPLRERLAAPSRRAAPASGRAPARRRRRDPRAGDRRRRAGPRCSPCARPRPGRRLRAAGPGRAAAGGVDRPRSRTSATRSRSSRCSTSPRSSRRAGDRDAARRALEQAVDLEPANPETWRRLGALRLRALDDPKGALRAYQAAYYLDPKSPRSVLRRRRRRARRPAAGSARRRASAARAAPTRRRSPSRRACARASGA